MLNKIKYWLDDAKLGMQVGQGDALKRQFLEALDRLSEADAEFQAAFASRAAEVFINTANQYGGHFNNVSKRGHLIIGKQLRK